MAWAMTSEGVSLPRVSVAVPGLRVAAVAAALGGALALRFALAGLHTTPDYFPDEYLYAALGRSLGSFQGPSVRGAAAHFPALLQPLLTGPAWRLGSVEASLRAVQAIESAAFTLAAIPAYLLARRVNLGRGLAAAVAAGALLVPDALYSGFVVAEPIAYPLVLAALVAGIASIVRPARRSQALFLLLSALAALARIELAVIPVCFAGAVVAVGLQERALRAALRKQVLAIGALAVTAALVVAAVAVHGLGYYAGARHLHFAPLAIGRNLTVLLYAGGWAVMPGAALGLWLALKRARTRAEAAFGWLVGLFAAALLLEASIWGDTSFVQERYVFYVLPLALIAFGLLATRGFPHRRAHALLALGLLVLSARVPLSGWAQPGSDDHSPFLLGVQRLESALGTAPAASAIAAAAGVLALVAAAAAWRPRLATRLLLGLSLAASATALAGATFLDQRNATAALHRYLPAGERSWIDETGVGPVTLLEGYGNRPTDGEEQLFWNRSVRNVAFLPAGSPPDRLASKAVEISPNGTLLAHGRPLEGPLLVDGYASTIELRGARLVATSPYDRLVRIGGAARLRLYISGRSADGWLLGRGAIVVWTDGPGRLVVRARGGGVGIGGRRTRGRTASFLVCRRGRFTVPFESALTQRLPDGRLAGGRMELPRFVPDPRACG